MGPPAYSPYPRGLESLTICWYNYKGSTFSSVILRLWVLVRPELNSRPPARQPDAQPTEPPVAVNTWRVTRCKIATTFCIATRFLSYNDSPKEISVCLDGDSFICIHCNRNWIKRLKCLRLLQRNLLMELCLFGNHPLKNKALNDGVSYRLHLKEVMLD